MEHKAERKCSVKVIVAPTMRECELEAFERGIPPRGRDVLLVPSNTAGSANKVRGLMLEREDVIVAGHLGRYHDDIMRTLEPAFVR